MTGNEQRPPLLDLVPSSGEPDDILEAFLAFCEGRGLDLYDAQEEAIMEIVSDRHVILATPTGSGKSLVGLAAHFTAISTGRRSYYTAPIKALVSEKFFELCRDLGTANVGMITGDGSVNPTAPVICCTAEILANLALSQGASAAVDHAVIDEFHFYSDASRGWAWQVPLIELTGARFLLMSATLGDTSWLSRRLEGTSGREVALVASDVRPVPLEFEYRESPLHESVEELLDLDRVPVYVVHFSQQAATEQAQSFTSLKTLDSDAKAAIKEALSGFRFDPGFGADLKKFLLAGIGVHHAGMLPRYRRLVERLAQGGLLKIICGTDTLGVGVNVPIRTVLFTQLCKYDGTRTRVLTVRDFHQIAGRAGRRGFDTQGTVWVQAPVHVIENARAEAKVAGDKKRSRKLVKKKPPEFGYAPWNADVLTKLETGTPETLISRFQVTPAMLLQVLDRPGDNVAALRRLLRENHDPRPRQREHIRRAVGIYRSLTAAGILEELDSPDDQGRRVRVALDLQEDFRLNRESSPFVLDAVELLDPSAPGFALDVLSVVEATLEDPTVVLRAQLKKVKGEAVAEMKAAGIEYEERMERLDELTWPQPLGEWCEATFQDWVVHHPWMSGSRMQPKSVARDMFERGLGFGHYVKLYGLKRSEGVLLRYLTDVFKALVQSVPEDLKSDELYDLTEWLGALVRSVDSSLLDEWERLAALERGEIEVTDLVGPQDDDVSRITANPTAFAVMVRNELFRWVRAAARRDHEALAELPSPPGRGRWRSDEVAGLLGAYWEEHDRIDTGADARSADLYIVDGDRVVQILADPEGWNEWRLVGSVDRVASDEASAAVVVLETIERLE